MSWSIFQLLLSCFFCISSLSAIDSKEASDQKNIFILSKDEVYEDNLYVAADTIEIAGVVKGDAYLLGSQIFIDGQVDGDLLSAGGSLDISGEVKGNLRVAFGQVNISGKIEKNITCLGANTQFTSSSVIKGKALLMAGNAELAGVFQNSLKAFISHLRIVGEIWGPIEASLSQLRIGADAVIKNTFSYRSSYPGWIDPKAQIEGPLLYQSSISDSFLGDNYLFTFLLNSKWISILMNVIYTVFAAYILKHFFPESTTTVKAYIRKTPLPSLLAGGVFVFALPILSVCLIISILGIPFAFTLIAVNVLGFYTAKTYTLMYLADWLHKWGKVSKNSRICFLLVLMLYFGLTAIPVLGIFIALLSMIMGMGGVVLAQSNWGLPKDGNYEEQATSSPTKSS
ncbi:MAG: hypothetical protein ACOVOR_01810 [Rhabdochlamydiaceae bacterium]